MLLLPVAADVRERQGDDREARRSGFFDSRGWDVICSAGLADLERIDPDRLGDVLELGRAEIANRQIKPTLDLPIGLLRETDRSWAWRSPPGA